MRANYIIFGFTLKSFQSMSNRIIPSVFFPSTNNSAVLSAKGILTKGKNGTNNCFVTIALGKEKFQTSIKEKSAQNVDWREECELYVHLNFITHSKPLIYYSRQ